MLFRFFARRIPLLGIFAGLAFCPPSIAAPVKIGAFVGGPETYPQPTEQNVAAFEALQGRPVDLLSLFVVWDANDWAWTRSFADVAEKRGARLVVTWMPNGYSAAKIVSGGADGYLRKYAQDVKAYGKEIWLRPLHEANGDWYDWGIAKAGAGNTDQNLIDAWRHIVTIFRDEAVSNVKWVWTTNATNSGSASFAGHYPGDAWVDMISIDGYNWGTAQSWSRWQSFAEVFGPAYAALAGIDKPLFIPEFSCSEHGGDKAAWIKETFAALPVKFPRIFALMWFNLSKSTEADWAVNTSAAAVAAWKEAMPATAVKMASGRGRASEGKAAWGKRGTTPGFGALRGQAREGRVPFYRPDGISLGNLDLTGP
jgi:mannan endo-1,4-beta-mannosidase